MAHDREIPAMLPGVPSTGKKMTVRGGVQATGLQNFGHGKWI
jgi:hypothetical protein